MRNPWKHTMLVFCGLAIVTMLTGCASTSTPSAGIMPPADVNGTWTGAPLRGATTITLVLNQQGTSVTGTLTGAGLSDGPITGTVEGNTLRLRDETGTAPLLNVKGDQITGMLNNSSVTLRRVK